MTIEISTHALREEGDMAGVRPCTRKSAISTHALREEGDGFGGWPLARKGDFYPRPPRGGRLAEALFIR